MWLQSLCNSWPTRGEAAKLSEISRIEDKLRQLQETVLNLEIQTKPAVDFNRFRYAKYLGRYAAKNIEFFDYSLVLLRVQIPTKLFMYRFLIQMIQLNRNEKPGGISLR